MTFKIHPESKPRINLSGAHRVLSQEKGLSTKGTNCDKAMERLAEVLEDGAECQGVKPLQLSTACDVQALRFE